MSGGGDDFLFDWLAALALFVAVGMAALVVAVVAGPPYLLFVIARRLIHGPRHMRQLRRIERLRVEALAEMVAIRKRAVAEMRAASRQRSRELGR
jgi:hypothetical protein